jgi:hypothetical protein
MKIAHSLTSWLTTASLATLLLAGCAAREDVAPAAPDDSAESPSAPAAPQASPTENSPATGTAQSAPMLADASPAAADDTAQWSLASPQAKRGVALDLKYQFDGVPDANQPVTVRVALVPRVAGSNLTFEVKSRDDLRVDAAPLALQKANAAGVYRHVFALTATSANPAPLQVLVGMDTVEGRSYGVYTIPVTTAATNIPQNKRESVKQR